MTSYKLTNNDVMERCIAQIKKSYGMEVNINKAVRSKASNRYYFNILEIICKDIGEDKGDLHDMIKLRVLGPRIITIRGETIQVPKRSADLTQEDFSKLIESALLLASSLGIVLPTPAEYGF